MLFLSGHLTHSLNKNINSYLRHNWPLINGNNSLQLETEQEITSTEHAAPE